MSVGLGSAVVFVHLFKRSILCVLFLFSLDNFVIVHIYFLLC